MLGEPKDVEGECNARLYLGDDHGDNDVTFRCRLEPGHPGVHRETFGGAPGGNNLVVVEWQRDQSAVCPRCGKRSPAEQLQDGTCCFTCPGCGETRSYHWHGALNEDGIPQDICEECSRPED
jgi:hypothetical protein